MNRIRNHDGSALFIVMIALLMITMLFSAVILYGSYHQQLAIQDVNETKAYYLAESGIEAALSRLNNNYQSAFDLSDSLESYGSFEVSVKPFGVYLLCKSTGVFGSRVSTIRCLIGGAPGDKYSNAINLGGQDYPLTLAGKTSIIGDVLVSPAGVLPGRYKGKRFGSDKLVYGNIVKSSFNRMPDYNDTIVNQFIDNIEATDFSSSSRYDKVFILNDENIAQIENDTTIEFTSDLSINLSNTIFDMTDKIYKIRGNLNITGISKIHGYGVILVEGKVTIENDCELKDVVILSNDEISVNDNVEYGGQLISYSSIKINDNSSLTHYAVVAGIGEITDEEICISITSTATISGVIIADYKLSDENQRSRGKLLKTIDIAQQADIRGVIYNSGYSKISGSITGNISTSSFYTYDSPTVYINWLVNAAVASSNDIKAIPAVLAGATGYEVQSGL